MSVLCPRGISAWRYRTLQSKMLFVCVSFIGQYASGCFLLSIWAGPRVTGYVSKRDQMFPTYFNVTQDQHKLGVDLPGWQPHFGV